MTRFEGKVALITGGRSGIGRAIAMRLAAEGARVFTAQRGADNEFDAIPADFTDPASPAQVVAEVTRRAGKLDVLVNNAGMMQEALAEDMSVEDWQRTLTVNLTAPFLMIKAALPHLRQTRGSIVNTGSIEGLGSNPGHAALEAAMVTAAKEKPPDDGRWFEGWTIAAQARLMPPIAKRNIQLIPTTFPTWFGQVEFICDTKTLSPHGTSGYFPIA